MISVLAVAPPGSEDQLHRCVAGYRETSPGLEVIAEVSASPTLGWRSAAARAGGEHLHFTTADLEPHPGWAEAALAACTAGYLPAAVVYRLDGGIETPAGGLLDWRRLTDTAVPFLPRRLWETITSRIEMGVLELPRWAGVAFRPAGAEIALRLEYAFTRWA